MNEMISTESFIVKFCTIFCTTNENGLVNI